MPVSWSACVPVLAVAQSISRVPALLDRSDVPAPRALLNQGILKDVSEIDWGQSPSLTVTDVTNLHPEFVP